MQKIKKIKNSLHVNMCIPEDTLECAYVHFKDEIDTKFYT